MATTEGSPVRDQHDDLEPTPSSRARQSALGLRLGIGIVSVVVGILLITRPTGTLLFLAVLVGVQLVILGAVRIALGAAAAAPPRWPKVVSIVCGVLTIIAGIICFVRPNAPLILIAVLLAIGWIADGLSELCRAFSRRTQGIEKTYALLSGVLAVAGGLIVALLPGESLVLLTQIAGVTLVVLGAFTCISALLSRRRHAAG